MPQGRAGQSPGLRFRGVGAVVAASVRCCHRVDQANGRGHHASRGVSRVPGEMPGMRYAVVAGAWPVRPSARRRARGRQSRSHRVDRAPVQVSEQPVPGGGVRRADRGADQAACPADAGAAVDARLDCSVPGGPSRRSPGRIPQDPHNSWLKSPDGCPCWTSTSLTSTPAGWRAVTTFPSSTGNCASAGSQRASNASAATSAPSDLPANQGGGSSRSPAAAQADPQDATRRPLDHDEPPAPHRSGRRGTEGDPYGLSSPRRRRTARPRLR